MDSGDIQSTEFVLRIEILNQEENQACLICARAWSLFVARFLRLVTISIDVDELRCRWASAEIS